MKSVVLVSVVSAGVLLLSGCNSSTSQPANPPAAQPAKPTAATPIPALTSPISINAEMVSVVDYAAHELWDVEKDGNKPKSRRGLGESAPNMPRSWWRRECSSGFLVRANDNTFTAAGEVAEVGAGYVRRGSSRAESEPGQQRRCADRRERAPHGRLRGLPQRLQARTAQRRHRTQAHAHDRAPVTRLKRDKPWRRLSLKGNSSESSAGITHRRATPFRSNPGHWQRPHVTCSKQSRHRHRTLLVGGF